MMLMVGGMSFIQDSTLDSMPPWGTLSETLQALTIHYIHHSWHTLPSSSPQLFVDNNKRPPRLNPILDTKVVQWNIFKSTYWSFLKALSLVYLKFCNLAFMYDNTTMRRRTNMLGKPPCIMSWSCNNNIPTCYQYCSQYMVTNVPY
jgi:hypothetical protein